MKNSGKILRAGFWLILIGSIALGYFKITESSQTEHFKYIPKQVDGVMVLDGRQISKKLVERYRFDPSGLEAILPKEALDGDDVQLENIGIDPFYKIPVFHFQIDKKYFIAGLIKCDTKLFLKHFKQRYGDELIEIYNSLESGVVCQRYQSKNQDVTICAGLGVGIYCSTVDGNVLSDSGNQALMTYLVSALEDPQDGLAAVNPYFASFISEKEDIGYWSNGKTKGFGALINGFTDSRTFFSFEKGAVEIASELEYADESPLKSSIRPLNIDAPFAFSFMANERESWSFIEQNIPTGFQHFFQNYNGNFFFEIKGHQFFQGFHMEDSIDIETFDSYEVIVPNKKLTPFPKFVTVFGMNDVAGYLDNLNSDSTYLLNKGYYEFDLINGVQCFLKVLDRNICISNSKACIEEIAMKPIAELYATYSLRLDFIALKESLPVKGDLGIGVPNMIVQTGFELLNFESVQIDVTEIQENTVRGKGSFKFKNHEAHSLVALLDMMNLAISNRGIIEAMLLQSDRPIE
ncbi:MAG: hypothetical protein P8M05_12720 [Flavobacteriales bacterium]|nr:hypothetical protein [Flavobacteriales bacterium]